jgi:F-type H+-transporting ATPase subunit b
MQPSDIISVNLWQILISLCNLLILFLILKKFLYQPVKRTMAQRQAGIDRQYNEAERARRAALADKEQWEEKLKTAQSDADTMLRTAAEQANYRRDVILADARQQADGIVRQAETEARLEKEKAAAEIKREIVDVSAALTEKLLSREIRDEDHRVLFQSFLESLGDDNDRNS